MAREVPQIILVAVDGSKPAHEAARSAVALAVRLGASLHIVSVVDYAKVTAVGLEPGRAWTAAAPELHAGARATLDAAAEEARRAGIPHAANVVEGQDAAAAIVGEAARVGADLLVVGSHGRTGVRRAVVGSVAEKVVRTAPCPVLVVR